MYFKPRRILDFYQFQFCLPIFVKIGHLNHVTSDDLDSDTYLPGINKSHFSTKPKMSNSTTLEESASIDPGFSAQNNSALLNFIELFNQNTQPPKQEFIFESGEEYLLITFYILILLLGLIFNAAIIWVILGK